MTKNSLEVDVLCVGHACYDLVFSLDKHPESDEKVFAKDLTSCGGGPAANAAIAIRQLGLESAFAGYLGVDIYGNLHEQELTKHQVDTSLIIRGAAPTPLSTVLVKPDGKRALINYKGSTQILTPSAIDFSSLNAKVILFDGHEPDISLALLNQSKKRGISTVLDAGSMHEGTSKLWEQVDYLVASEKFALGFDEDVNAALKKMAETSANVVITLGENGLIWQKDNESGELPALPIKAVDTTGAGDAFHGAFAAALALGMDWLDILKYSTAAGALCCTKTGARTGLPKQQEHQDLYLSSQIK